MQSSGDLPDYFKAREFLVEAYYAGLINWNVYQAAWNKTEQVKNGSWMFERKKSF
jgi:hypothetical protein